MIIHRGQRCCNAFRTCKPRPRRTDFRSARSTSIELPRDRRSDWPRRTRADMTITSHDQSKESAAGEAANFVGVTPRPKRARFLAIQPGAQPTTIRVMAYDQTRVEKKIEAPGELHGLGKWPGVGRCRRPGQRGHAAGDMPCLHPPARAGRRGPRSPAGKVEATTRSLFIVMRIPNASNEQLCEQFSYFWARITW